MEKQDQTALEDVFNSMLRTDYIPLRDTEKLQRLARYYIDYFGYLRQVVSESDHLIIGRRGTGKTTLLYRALIECIHSWGATNASVAKKRTLAIYLDLSKCHTLSDTSSTAFSDFEHVFISELVDSINEELERNWPELKKDPSIFSQIFNRQESHTKKEGSSALTKLSKIVLKGIPREENEPGPTQHIRKTKDHQKSTDGLSGKMGITDASLSVNLSDSSEYTDERSEQRSTLTKSRLTIADILRVLGDLRKACKISHIIILIDEFSALPTDLQRRFSSLLRKFLGNHSGVYIKLCAITDNYTLGSSIILQRDLFQLSLDLDSFVERSGNLNLAMEGLRDLANNLVSERIKEYTGKASGDFISDTDESWNMLSRSAMGIPRTIGITLKQALYRCIGADKKKIRASDIEYGLKYATKAYTDQFLGACGVAIPSFNEEVWNTLTDRAIEERAKIETSCRADSRISLNRD